MDSGTNKTKKLTINNIFHTFLHMFFSTKHTFCYVSDVAPFFKKITACMVMIFEIIFAPFSYQSFLLFCVYLI